MDYVIRALTKADEPVLWDMLFQAIQATSDAPSRDVVQEPKYARYVENWGRTGDTGFIVSDKATSEVLGAVWYRMQTHDATGHGAPGDAIPELAFAVKAGQRKRGLGAALLTQLVKANPHHSAISIRASANNPAVRLYERFGFQVVSDKDGTLVMRREA